MKNVNYKSWVSSVVVCITCLTASFTASAENEINKSAFKCMDKESFEVNEKCMADRIASHDSFENKQNQIAESVAIGSDMAMATMIFDNRNMTIRIIAHKDATFAKLESVDSDKTN